MDFKTLISNPDALNDLNNLPRNERMKAISQLDPDFSNLKTKDKFNVLDSLESHNPSGVGAGDFERSSAYPNSRITSTPPEVQAAITAGLTPPLVTKPIEAGVNAGEKVASFASRVKNALGAPTVRESYDSLAETLAKHGIEPGTSEITENTPKAIADYAKTTKSLLKLGENKGREFLADEETELANTPSKLERIREDVTRIFNNKWESPNTQVGRDLSQIKETASQRLAEKVPEVGKALKTVKSAFDKEKLLDAITKSAKVLGTAAVSGTAIGAGIKLGQKVAAPFQTGD